MTTSIKNLIMMILVTTILSCNQNPSLQTYFVDNELKPGFTSIDIPTSFLNIDQTNLTEEQKDAYKSIDKLNMLAFVLSDKNKEEYQLELNKVKGILDNEKYEELMRGGNSTDGKFIIKFIGEEDSIDELILFGNANERGFAIIRVLGDDMSAKKIMKLYYALDTAQIDESQISQFADFFK
ncbi:uncharacterized protein DUF4252 [Flavobacteriaceae bacterium MAR_2010_72]|nr:uncharacterized protein DUF4252 [Flavobacteriaceae bacterium MAR_2010_72]TVZ59337.1 uncharacterized protein DUF4252 [Flavobacteriaceae bacterium MAR_2010_105]